MFTIKHVVSRIGLAFTAGALVFHLSVAHAIPFASGLIITGDTTFDNVFSFGPTSGDFSVVSGGSTTTSTYADFSVIGANPLGGSLTDIGDGFGFTGIASATDEEFAIGIDTAMSLTNSSASDIYLVTFKLSYSNLVNADGGDAFADSELTLDSEMNLDGNITEEFFTDLKSDTFFGDEIGGGLTGGFGDILSESGDMFLSFTLNPSDFLDLNMIWTLEGGDFDGALAEAELSAFISIDSVVVKTPLPGTLFLVGIGLILLPLQRRMRAIMEK